jgi:hypothetical protein
VSRDRKAHQLIGRKLSSRTGSVQDDGCGRLAHGDGRSGEEQTQRRGVNIIRLNMAASFSRAGPPVRHIRLKSVRSLSWLATAADREGEFAKGRVPRESAGRASAHGVSWRVAFR